MSQPLKCVIFTAQTDGNVIGNFLSRLIKDPMIQIGAVIQEIRPAPSRRTYIRELYLNGGMLALAVFGRDWLMRKLGTLKNSLLSGWSRLGLPPDENTPQVPDVCRRFGILCFVTPDIHSTETLGYVATLDADLGVIYGTRKLRPELFTLPTAGSINIHKRKVPDFRGGGPIGLWELLTGKTTIGVTIHHVDENLDTGDVILTDQFPIDPHDTLESLKIKADFIGDRLYARAIGLLARGRAPRLPQNQLEGKTYKSPSSQQLQQYVDEINRRNVWSVWPRSIRGRLFQAFYYYFLLPLLRYQWRRKHRWPVAILYYHLVTDKTHPMGITTTNFARQLDWLKRHFGIVDLPTALNALTHGQVERPMLSITFDDGYKENMLNALAVLYKFQVRATFFICPGNVETHKAFTHDLRDGVQGFGPMNWTDLKELIDEGHEISCHTMNHFDCKSQDTSLLRYEITEAKHLLEAKLKGPIRYFSYPWGHRNNMSSEAQKEVSAAGFACAFSAYGGLNRVDQRLNVHDVKRIPAPVGSDLNELSVRTLGYYDFLIGYAES